MGLLEANWYPMRNYEANLMLEPHGLCENLTVDGTLERVMLAFDGTRSILDIATDLDTPFERVADYASRFAEKELVKLGFGPTRAWQDLPSSERIAAPRRAGGRCIVRSLETTTAPASLSPPSPSHGGHTRSTIRATMVRTLSAEPVSSKPSRSAGTWCACSTRTDTRNGSIRRS